MGWVDSHCHLNFPQFDFEQLLPELKAVGCEGVLVPATTAASFDSVLQLKQTHPGCVFTALGLHPYFIDQHETSHLQRLDDAIREHQPHALGEFGLDAMLDGATWNQQLFYFNQQLEIAKSHGLPLVIHCLKAHDELASLVRKSGFTHGGFIHGFSGSLQQAQRYLDLGFVVGIGGAVTYERAKAMHKMVAALPDDGYVLETDSPDMAPAFVRDKANSPLNIPGIAQFIAQLRGQSIEQIYVDTTRNVERVLHITVGA